MKVNSSDSSFFVFTVEHTVFAWNSFGMEFHHQSNDGFLHHSHITTTFRSKLGFCLETKLCVLPLRQNIWKCYVTQKYPQFRRHDSN